VHHNLRGAKVQNPLGRLLDASNEDKLFRVSLFDPFAQRSAVAIVIDQETVENSNILIRVSRPEVRM
jgi:hypothetical protein